MSDLSNFIRWYAIPVQALKNIPNGDGGFVIMSIGLALCERWHRIESGEQDDWKKEEFKIKAADHFNIDKQFFSDFWDVYRNGLQHQGSPKWRSGDGAARKPYGWLTHDSFPPYPVLGISDSGKECICIDPFKFTDHYIQLFLSHPQKLSEAVHHSFGGIGCATLANLRTVPPT